MCVRFERERSLCNSIHVCGGLRMCHLWNRVINQTDGCSYKKKTQSFHKENASRSIRNARMVVCWHQWPHVTHQSGVGASMVVDFFEIVQPDLGSSHTVCQSFAPWVRGLFREHMAHVGTWVDLQGSPALPNLKDINNNALRIDWVSQPWISHFKTGNTKHALVRGVGNI